MLRAADGLGDTERARRRHLPRRGMSLFEGLSIPLLVIYQTYKLLMTHFRVYQVTDPSTMGPQWPQTMLFHGFYNQSRASHTKECKVLSFVQLYAPSL